MIVRSANDKAASATSVASFTSQRSVNGGNSGGPVVHEPSALLDQIEVPGRRA